MVKFSPIALNFGYDFVLLVHFLGHPVYFDYSEFAPFAWRWPHCSFSLGRTFAVNECLQFDSIFGGFLFMLFFHPLCTQCWEDEMGLLAEL